MLERFPKSTKVGRYEVKGLRTVVCNLLESHERFRYFVDLSTARSPRTTEKHYLTGYQQE